jgi:hypothetical protein
VIEALLLGYVAVGLATALITFVMSKRLVDRRRPAPHPAAGSLMAGALWPLLLVGALELGSVALLVAWARPKRGLAVHA